MGQFATVEQVKAARAASGLSMLKAGPVIGYSSRAWERWEGGTRKMRAALLESFIAKTQGDKK